MHSTRRQIITFLILLGVIWGLFSILLIKAGGGMEANIPYAVVLMFSPMISALCTHLIYYKNIRTIARKRPQRRHIARSYFLPLVYVTVVYTVIVLFDIGHFDTSIVNSLGVSDVVGFFLINVLVNCLIVIGEEIGWRGFLLPKLSQIMSFNRASLLVGALRALFHFPILIYTDYIPSALPLWLGLLCFSCAIVGINMAMNWLRLISGSIWTVVLFHAAHNSFIQDMEGILLVDDTTIFFSGEFGVLLAGIGIVLGIIFWQKGRNIGKLSSIE